VAELSIPEPKQPKRELAPWFDQAQIERDRHARQHYHRNVTPAAPPAPDYPEPETVAERDAQIRARRAAGATTAELMHRYRPAALGDLGITTLVQLSAILAAGREAGRLGQPA
jgi:hypothetical protein